MADVNETEGSEVKSGKFKLARADSQFSNSSEKDEQPAIESGLKRASGVDFESLLNWTPPASFEKDYFYEICGKSYTGCPVVTCQLGHWDFRKLNSQEARETWLKYIDSMFAKIDQKMKKNSITSGEPVTQFVNVLDFENFTMKQILSFSGMSNIRQLARRYEAKYGGSLKKCFVVNASVTFRTLCSLLKPMLSSKTLGSLEIYGTNQNEWKTALLTQIPEDQLPFRLGGSLVPAGTQVVDFKRLIYGRRYSLFANASIDEDEDEENGN